MGTAKKHAAAKKAAPQKRAKAKKDASVRQARRTGPPVPGRGAIGPRRRAEPEAATDAAARGERAADLHQLRGRLRRREHHRGRGGVVHLARGDGGRPAARRRGAALLHPADRHGHAATDQGAPGAEEGRGALLRAGRARPAPPGGRAGAPARRRPSKRAKKAAPPAKTRRAAARRPPPAKAATGDEEGGGEEGGAPAKKAAEEGGGRRPRRRRKKAAAKKAAKAKTGARPRRRRPRRPARRERREGRYAPVTVLPRPADVLPHRPPVSLRHRGDRGRPGRLRPRTLGPDRRRAVLRRPLSRAGRPCPGC